MTDDSLRSAIASVPENAIVVIEDIDALFTKDRKKKVEKSPLTFSGLLNALDGVGSGTGQLFILTTNLRDELDPALIRNGRVDLHIQFGYAEEEQMRDMWNGFYPDATPHMADTFVATLNEKLGARSIVMASLQHFFIQQMFKPAEEALLAVDSIIEELKQRETEEVTGSNTTKDNEKKNDDDNDTDGTDKESTGSKDGEQKGAKAKASVEEVHVHVHVHLSGKKEGNDAVLVDKDIVVVPDS